MDEGEGRRGRIGRSRQGNQARNREDAKHARLLAGRVCALIGILSAAGGVVLGPIMAGGAGVSAGVLGVILGILAYFLGARKTGTLAVIVSVAALFFGLAASQGLIPGIDASDHDLPAIESDADGN